MAKDYSNCILHSSNASTLSIFSLCINPEIMNSNYQIIISSHCINIRKYWSDRWSFGLWNAFPIEILLRPTIPFWWISCLIHLNRLHWLVSKQNKFPRGSASEIKPEWTGWTTSPWLRQMYNFNQAKKIAGAVCYKFCQFTFRMSKSPTKSHFSWNLFIIGDTAERRLIETKWKNSASVFKDNNFLNWSTEVKLKY